MTVEEILIRLAGGAVLVCICKLCIAYIQRHREKIVDVSFGADGSQRLTVKGYDQPEQEKILKLFTRHIGRQISGTKDSNGLSSVPKILKS